MEGSNAKSWVQTALKDKQQRRARRTPVVTPNYPINTRLGRKWDIWKLAVDVEPFFLPHKSEKGLMTAKTWWGDFETECVVLMLLNMALYLDLYTFDFLWACVTHWGASSLT